MGKKDVEIVTIGGRSSYTSELIEGFIKRYHELPVKESLDEMLEAHNAYLPLFHK